MKTLIPTNVIDDFFKQIEITDLNKASIRQVLACEMNAEKVTGQEFIHFEMGVPGIPPSAVGIKAQKEALDRGVASKYPNIEGIPELKEQAARFVKAFINTDIEAAHCTPTRGAMQGTFAAFLLCSQLDPKKDTILYIDPGFPVQKMQANVMGVKTASFDVADFRAEKLAPKLESYLKNGNICCIVYSNPNNPSWMCLTESEIKTIGELATKYDTVILEDLAYMTMDFRREGLGEPFKAPYQVSVSHYTDNYIMMLSGSKIFSYAGERIAVACISDKLFVRSYETLQKRYSISRFGAVYAYDMLYAMSSGVTHSVQFAMAAMLKAACDGDYKFREDIREYARRTEKIKAALLRNGFNITYDKDLDEDVSNGFFFTFSYNLPDGTPMEGGQLLHELLYYGISGITLKSTGSTRQGIRGCSSNIREDQFPLLEERLKMFNEAHK
ncbi:MAG: pyridoxal phosphate-dependent aminotransferase [Bacteroidetes bacterium]|nr:pyridoxal phosphate-dependent aminotransferase [Candidatus Colenecus caballi]